MLDARNVTAIVVTYNRLPLPEIFRGIGAARNL